MLLDDELAAQRHHEEYAEPSAEQRQGKNSPEGEFRAKAQEDQRGNGEHHAGCERFARGAGGLHDVVFKNGGTAEGPQDANGQNGNGDGCGNGESGAQSYVNGDGAEEQAEQRAEDYCAESKFFEGFFSGNKRPEFAWRCSGTPWTFAQRKPPGGQTKLAACGIMP